MEVDVNIMDEGEKLEIKQITNSISDDVCVKGNESISLPTSLDLQPEVVSERESLSGVSDEKRNVTTSHLRYEYNDMGPFFVTVKLLNQQMKYMHPLKIGRWLFQKGYEVTHLHKSGFNQVEVHFANYFHANKFLDSGFDAEHNAYSFIPYYNLHVVGVIRGVDIDITTEEMMMNFKAALPVQVTNVYRFNRKEIDEKDKSKHKFVPTQTVKVTFRTQKLPPKICLFYQQFNVEKFKEKVILCENCGKLNHKGKFCKNRQRCLQCSLEHDNYNSPCPSKVFKCINCGLGHSTRNTGSCSAYQLELNITDKIQDLPISRYEAKQILLGRQTYAEMVQAHMVQKKGLDVVAFPLLQTEAPNPSIAQQIGRSRSVPTETGTAAKRKKISTSPSSHSSVNTELQKCLIAPHGRRTKSESIVAGCVRSTSTIQGDKTPKKGRFSSRVESASSQVGREVPRQDDANSEQEKSKLRIAINDIIQEAPDYLRESLEKLKAHLGCY